VNRNGFAILGMRSCVDLYASGVVGAPIFGKLHDVAIVVSNANPNPMVAIFSGWTCLKILSKRLSMV
jgi:hypothetical protein